MRWILLLKGTHKDKDQVHEYGNEDIIKMTWISWQGKNHREKRYAFQYLDHGELYITVQKPHFSSAACA